MKSTLPIAAIILGAALMLFGAAWGVLFPSTRVWTPEKSDQLTQLGSKANLLKFAVVEAKANPGARSAKNPAELQQQYDQALEEYDQLHQEFLNAKQQPEQAATFLHWTGMVLIAGGAIFTYAARNA